MLLSDWFHTTLVLGVPMSQWALAAAAALAAYFVMRTALRFARGRIRQNAEADASVRGLGQVRPTLAQMLDATNGLLLTVAARLRLPSSVCAASKIRSQAWRSRNWQKAWARFQYTSDIDQPSPATASSAPSPAPDDESPPARTAAAASIGNRPGSPPRRRNTRCSGGASSW